jgi:hypothetical protein
LEFDDQTTRIPDAVAEPPLAGSTIPPILGTDTVYVDSSYEDSEYSEVFSTLLTDMTVNLQALQELLPAVSEPVQSAISETMIAIETGYSVAIDSFFE